SFNIPDDAFAWVECSNCKSRNRKSEIFCYSCGHLLEAEQGVFDTRHFADATAELFSSDYFGPESLLILQSRETSIPIIEIRPQLRSHELVVGRSTDNSAMTPDIDLANANGAEKGVSRLHLSLKYETSDNAIQIYDLGSSNGSFVNGQKLHPKELRVLRSGDDLRLGRLVVRVRFSHPGEEIS
ncbi:MAG: FHA domain-containing protein, partial [Aggregatilineales bacterium]